MTTSVPFHFQATCKVVLGLMLTKTNQKVMRNNRGESSFSGSGICGSTLAFL